MKKIITFILILTFILSVCNFLPVLAEEQAVDKTTTNENVVLAEETEETENSENVEESIEDTEEDSEDVEESSDDETAETDQPSQKELTDEEKEQIIFQYMEDTAYELQNSTDETPEERKWHDFKLVAKSEHKSVNEDRRANDFSEWFFEKSKKLYKMIINNGVEISQDDYISGVENAINKGDKTYDNTSYLITLSNGDLKYVEGTNVIGDYGEVIGENGDIITPEFKQYANLYVFGGLERKYEFIMKNEYVSMSFDFIGNEEITQIYYKVDNPQEIVDFLAITEGFEDIDPAGMHWNKEKEVVIDWNDNTCNGEPMRLVDTLDFEIDVTEELYHSIFQTVSETGETAKVTIKHIQILGAPISLGTFTKHINIFTMSGSKGEVTGFSTISDGGFFDSTRVALTSDYIIKDDIFYMKNSDNDNRWRIYIYGSGSDGDITGVRCNFFYYPVYEKDSGVTYSFEGKNVKYAFCLDEEEWEKNENLYRLWTTNKEDYLEEKNKLFKEAEQKRKDAGIIVGTNKVLSMAKAEIDIDETYAPAWYKNLGDNVSLILYGIAKETPNSRDCMPMLRFQGDDGVLWFEWGSMRGYQDVSYEFEWNSLISFDGKNAVGSSSNYETLSGVMTFTDKYLDNFALTIGEETVNLTPDDFNIFGTDNLYHDDLIESVRIVDDEYWETVDDYMFIM